MAFTGVFKGAFFAALCAGVAAGLVAALLQFFFVIPLLLEGELYESGARLHFAVDGTTQSDRASPALGNDWGRHSLTVAFNIVSYTGFALALVALMGLARAHLGAAIQARSGLLWGLCGFIAVQLAPAFGLPPELPGVVGADLGARQLWWGATILATASGLALIAFCRGLLWPLLGMGVILLPQAVGAPHLESYFGVAPPELAAEFATRSLGVAAVGWAMLGYLCGWLLQGVAAPAPRRNSGALV
ncbi:MAG: CbtA family protein [Rhodobacteraceae bacterium]|nr:CbtA family protein [Paracoccaceae bacterium]